MADIEESKCHRCGWPTNNHAAECNVPLEDFIATERLARQRAEAVVGEIVARVKSNALHGFSCGWGENSAECNCWVSKITATDFPRLCAEREQAGRECVEALRKAQSVIRCTSSCWGKCTCGAHPAFVEIVKVLAAYDAAEKALRGNH